MKVDKEVFNEWAAAGKPFLFLIDYTAQHWQLFPLNEKLNTIIDKKNTFNLLYNLNGITNTKIKTHQKFQLNATPPTFAEYQKSFDKVKNYIKRGDSYLVNLTFATPVTVETLAVVEDSANSSHLSQLFHRSHAKYKVYFKDDQHEFLCFSPEIFVQIKGNNIYSYPMKGTINAEIPNAESTILADEKEQAEHATIVDLIRNDLSIIADDVTVEAYRYIDRVKKHNGKSLLQVSSRIRGVLPTDWKARVGDILFALLPAGSICGAPKPKTLDIIAQVEDYTRGYYTGIVGIFDGENLDSGVLIRFIENTNNGLVFKSGGGITHFSQAQKEYQELIDKIYVAV